MDAATMVRRSDLDPMPGVDAQIVPAGLVFMIASPKTKLVKQRTYQIGNGKNAGWRRGCFAYSCPQSAKVSAK
jgi:hypothetical protein